MEGSEEEGLSNIYIHNHLSDQGLSNFAGVYSSNTIPKRLTEEDNFTIIVNLSTNREKGTHFITICKKNNTLHLLDSLGSRYEQLPAEIRNFLSPDTIQVFKSRIQPILSNFCGFYSIYFVLFTDDAIPSNIKKACSPFKQNTDLNDDICIKNISTILRNKKRRER